MGGNPNIHPNDALVDGFWESNMSTYVNASSAPLGLRSPAAATQRTPSAGRNGARGLSFMLLAAVVAAMVVLADRLISTWADGHLLLAWVLLWVVVFAGMALFADSARALARRTMASLDAWSRSLAQKRAEERLWDIARADPRVMAELVSARSRTEEAAPAALPATAETAAVRDMGFWEKLGRERAGRALF
jgi:hypothetical protein